MTRHEPTPFSDILREMRGTGSVKASTSVLIHSIRQRLEAALEHPVDTMGLTALVEDLRDHDRIHDAVAHKTSLAREDGDVDRSAPAPAGSDVAAAGGSVYGSQGPLDTDTQRNTSAGYAGKDAVKGQPIAQTNAMPEDWQKGERVHDGAGSSGGESRGGETKPVSEGAPGITAPGQGNDTQPARASGTIWGGPGSQGTERGGLPQDQSVAGSSSPKPNFDPPPQKPWKG